MACRSSLARAFSTVGNKIIETTKDKNIVNLSNFDNGNPEIQALVIVNNTLNLKWLEKGINASSHIVIADGGANKLFQTPFKDSNKIHAIVGDFDSLKQDVRQYYENKGIAIQKIEDQNTNDFEKAFSTAIKNNWSKILCLGAFGGRMDHALSGMSDTVKLCRKYSNLQVLLVGKQNIMYYMRPHIKHQITISDCISNKGCGIIRFGSKIHAETRGFKWNLGKSHQFSTLEWGNFISTSNEIINKTVEIQSEGDLFFTMHFKEEKM